MNHFSTAFRRLSLPGKRDMKLLLFWPLFGLAFLWLEQAVPVSDCTPMRCILDGLIPFCPWFVIPYGFWFLSVGGMVLYTLLWEPAVFRKLMRFIGFTYSAALVICLLFPSRQDLRPALLPADGLLSALTAMIYASDTNTNVCPSIHVIGSVAVYLAAEHTRRFSGPVWRGIFLTVTVLICLSTVFLKQHSVLDVLAALPVCAGGCLLAGWPDCPELIRSQCCRGPEPEGAHR